LKDQNLTDISVYSETKITLQELLSTSESFITPNSSWLQVILLTT